MIPTAEAHDNANHDPAPKRRLDSLQRWLVPALLFAAFTARIIAAEVMYHRPARLPDSMLYLAYAEKVYRGEGFRVGNDAARRPPGYPVYLVLCNKLMPGDPLSEDRDRRRERLERFALWGQAILGTLTCWIAYLIARNLERTYLTKGAALLTLFFSAADPYAIIVGSLALSETLFATLFLASAYLIVRFREPPSALADLVLGVLIGAAVLVRPSGLLLPIVVGIGWLLFSGDRAQILRRLAKIAIGFILISAPWWYRNYQEFGKFVPTTLNVGESLYDGLNPNADGGSDTSFADDIAVRKLDEVSRDRWWWDQAKKFAADNPRRVLELAVIKLGRFWSPWPNEKNFRSSAILIVSALATIPVWFAALVGIYSVRRQYSLLVLCLLPTIYFCAMHMVFVSSVRYRVPTMPLFYILASIGVIQILRWKQSR